MYICKHCNKQIVAFDDISVYDCFIGKTVFIEEDSNVLFYYTEDKHKYSKRIYCLFYIYCLFSIHVLLVIFSINNTYNRYKS